MLLATTVILAIQAWRHVPSHFNNETPFDSVIAKAMAKRPEDRFKTAAEFADATRVDDVRAGRTCGQPNVSPFQPHIAPTASKKSM